MPEDEARGRHLPAAADAPAARDPGRARPTVRVTLLMAIAIAASIGVPSSALALPRVSSAWHEPSEVRAELRRLERDHPERVRVSVIGRSYEGQDILMA